MRNDFLLRILRCPLHPDAGPLRLGPKSEVSCRCCGRAFPSADGIPDMVVPDRGDEAFVEAETRQWDAHAPVYEDRRGRDPVYMAGVKAAVSALDARPGELILDAGCGTGLTVRQYVRRGMFLAAVDLSQRSLRRLREVVGDAAAPVRGDLLRLPFADNTFDRVVSGNALTQLPGDERRRRCVAELARVAKPGARVVITAHNLSVRAKRAGWCKEGPVGSHSGPVNYLYRYEADEYRDFLSGALRLRGVTGAGFPLPYRLKLSPVSAACEHLLRRLPAAAGWGQMLVGVGTKEASPP
jgi:SAM-dependent methyltransferase